LFVCKEHAVQKLNNNNKNENKDNSGNSNNDNNRRKNNNRRITIGFTITISITIQITTLRITMTPGLTNIIKWGRHMDGPIRCSLLTLQRDENQMEPGQLIKQ
jgi:hypothetical protein